MKETNPLEKHRDIYGKDPEHIVALPLPIVMVGTFASVHGGQSLLTLLEGGVVLTASRSQRKETYVRNISCGETRHFSLDNTEFRAADHWANAFKAVWIKAKAKYRLSSNYDITISGPALERDLQTATAEIFVGFLRLLERILGITISGDEVLEYAWNATSVFPFYTASYRDLLLLSKGRIGRVYLYDEGRGIREETSLAGMKRFSFISTGIPYRVLAEEIEELKMEASQLLSSLKKPFSQVTLPELPLVFPGLSSRKNGILRHLVLENTLVPRIFRRLQEGNLREAGRLCNQYTRTLMDDALLGAPETEWVLRRLVAFPGIDGIGVMDGGLCGLLLAVVEPGTVPPYNLDGDEYYRTFGYRLGFSVPGEGDLAHTLDQ